MDFKVERDCANLGHFRDFAKLGQIVESISQPWHCLAPMLSAKSQGYWISWKEV